MAEIERVLWIALGGLTAAIMGYFGSYLKEKGKNYATKEDFDDLRIQQQELTRATKEIEATISNEVWNRQRQWELKREALLDGARATNDFLAAVMKVNAAYSIEEKQNDLAFGTQLANHQTEAMKILSKASYDFQRAQVFVAVVGGIETQTAFVAMERILKTTSSRIVDGDTDVFRKAMPLIKVSATAITNAIRKELGIESVGLESTFLSTESLEAPVPGSSGPATTS